MGKVTPVINMNGKCEEAIHYYEDIFTTKADFILHYSDADPNDWKMPLSEEQKKYVYHCEMEIYTQRFMFSDIIGYEINTGNSFFCVITLDTKEDVEAIYKKVESESTILMPLHSSTYSSAEVSFIDKYGIRWGIMTEGAEK